MDNMDNLKMNVFLQENYPELGFINELGRPVNLTKISIPE